MSSQKIIRQMKISLEDKHDGSYYQVTQDSYLDIFINPLIKQMCLSMIEEGKTRWGEHWVDNIDKTCVAIQNPALLNIFKIAHFGGDPLPSYYQDQINQIESDYQIKLDGSVFFDKRKFYSILMSNNPENKVKHLKLIDDIDQLVSKNNMKFKDNLTLQNLEFILLNDLNFDLVTKAEKSKQRWFDLFRHYEKEKIIQYGIRGSTLGHWSLLVQLSNGIFFIIELQSTNVFDHIDVILFFDTKPLQNKEICVVNLSVRENCIGFDMKHCYSSFTDLILLASLDKQLYTEYNSYLNNGQQFIIRICEKMGWEVKKKAFISESLAAIGRNS